MLREGGTRPVRLVLLSVLQRHAGIEEDETDSSEESEEEMEVGEGAEEGEDDDEEGEEGRRHVMQCIPS